MPVSHPTAPRPFTGWHMLLVICSFFGVVISVNVTLAVLSSTSWTGLVVPNTYVASQEFDDKRLAHEAQIAAGWQSEFDYDGTRLRILIVDGAGDPVPVDELTVQINRPVGGHDDQLLKMVRTADGAYEAPLALAPGLWEALAVDPETALGRYELHTRFVVKGLAKDSEAGADE